MNTSELLDGFRQVAEKSLDCWGLQGELNLIKHRENSVYEVNTDSERFALRVHRQDYHSDSALRSELHWTRALQAFGVGVPESIPASDGRDFVRVSVPELPGEFQVDMMAWIDGEQIGNIETGLGEGAADCFRSIGQVAAQIHNQASNWQLPEGFVRHAWNIDGLVGPEPFWGKFWELSELTDDQLRLIHEAREKVALDLEAFGQSKEDYSMIHSDFVPENFLRDGAHVQVIDFDDAGFGWHLFDLATALYFIQDDPAFDTAKTGLIDGYREFRDLPDEKLDQLPLFTAARSFTYLGWLHTRERTDETLAMTPALIELCCAACEAYL